MLKSCFNKTLNFAFYQALLVISFRQGMESGIILFVYAYDNDAALMKFGGLKWTRTTDLTLIRRAL